MKHAVFQLRKTVEVRGNPKRAVRSNGESLHPAFEGYMLKMPIAKTGKPVRHIESKPEVAIPVLHYRGKLRCQRAGDTKCCSAAVFQPRGSSRSRSDPHAPVTRLHHTESGFIGQPVSRRVGPNAAFHQLIYARIDRSNPEASVCRLDHARNRIGREALRLAYARKPGVTKHGEPRVGPTYPEVSLAILKNPIRVVARKSVQVSQHFQLVAAHSAQP